MNTAISGLYFFNFSTRILPPSRNSLLEKKTNSAFKQSYTCKLNYLKSEFMYLFISLSTDGAHCQPYLERSLLPGVALDTMLVKPILYLTGSDVSCMWLSCSSVNPDRNRHFPVIKGFSGYFALCSNKWNYKSYSVYIWIGGKCGKKRPTTQQRYCRSHCTNTNTPQTKKQQLL